MPKEIIINTPDALPHVVNELLKFADGKKIIAFYGQIGAGKTTFIKHFCRHLQVNESVTSPTFAIVHEYTYGKSGLIRHLDMYRIRKIEEAFEIGIEDFFYEDNYCLIEWPEIIESLLPEDAIKVKIEIIEDSRRKFLFL